MGRDKFPESAELASRVVRCGRLWTGAMVLVPWLLHGNGLLLGTLDP
jgi:hypothetical protein